MELVETVKINANYTCIYNTVLDGTPNVKTDTSEFNFFDNFHDCRMSAAAIKTIKKATNVILYLSKKRHFQEFFKSKKVGCTSFRKNDLTNYALHNVKNRFLCTFVTLTLPAVQKHSDKELTKYVLHPFLSYARKFFKVRYFIWKKELQKNGNLHYHLICDRFIDCNCLRKTWNRLLNRGKIAECEQPFDYVDRYNKRMKAMFSNGWNEREMWNYFKKSNAVIEKTDADVKEYNQKNHCECSYIEYEQILIRNTESEYNKAFNRYINEMKKPINQRFQNPNSTDISAVNNPRMIAAYIAKYISKDIDDIPAISQFQLKVSQIKDVIFSLLMTIKQKNENKENTDSELELLQKYKESLRELREKECPVSGKLWFKSATLTPFLKGATDFITYDIDIELRRCIAYLKAKQEKTGRKLICQSFELDENGKETDKIICTTLLVSVFELQHLKENKKLLFPQLSLMWSKFVSDCIAYNKANGLYEYDCFSKKIKKNENR